VDLSLASVLTAAGAGVAGVFVASIVQLIKPLLPDTWQTGRAMFGIVYVLSALLVAAAVAASPDLHVSDAAGWAGAIFLAVASWQAVAGAAIGTNQVARKVQAISSGTTDPAGQDVPGAEPQG
jgi:hypothetical protein